MSKIFVRSWKLVRNGNSVIRLEPLCDSPMPETKENKIPVEEGEVWIAEAETGEMQYDSEENTLYLYENRDYWVTYAEEGEEALDRELLNQLLTKRIRNQGILNSGNYVGELEIGIKGIQIRILSHKIEYDRDFAFLQREIAEFCEGLLSRSSSFFAEHFEKTADYAEEKINYAEVAYLKDILSPDKLPAWIDYLAYHPEHSYDREVQRKLLADVEDADADAFVDAFCAGNLMPSTKVNRMKYTRGMVPVEIDASVSKMTYDTKENRFVKFFLRYLRDFVEELREACDKDNRKLSYELEKMSAILSERCCHPFWDAVGQMETVPFNSQILQRKFPYHLIFQAYNEFFMSAGISRGDLDRQYAVGQKDAPLLYQYWVFLKIFTYLCGKYGDRYQASDWLAYDKHNLSFNLREGRKSYAKFQLDEDRELYLYYNKTYDIHHSVEAGRSYSHSLKPDISLELFCNQKMEAMIHFDAKYKLPQNGTDVPYDMNKMHAYKDAILGTVGAYAVCLAKEKVIYRPYDKDQEKDQDKKEIFPSVGAFPLNLHPDTLKAEMEEILSLIDRFIEFCSREKRKSQRIYECISL